MLPAQILERHPSINLVQKSNDPLFAESVLHARFSSEKRTPLTSR